MDTTLKERIVLEAVRNAGPGATSSQVGSEALRIAKLLMPGSSVMNQLDYFTAKHEDSKRDTFVATLVHADLEVSSKRGVIFLHNERKNEFEVIRTDITSGASPEAQAAQALVIDARRNLIGHRVAVTKRMERMGNSNNVRVVDDLLDQGIDPEFVKDRERFTIDWDAWAQSKKTPTRDNLKDGEQAFPDA